jgi:F-type H+-transporting ATPase subunit delta
MANNTYIDPPPDALDKVYAQSLFELAEGQGGRAMLEEMADEIDQFEETRGTDTQVTEFFRSKVIPAKAKVEVLRKTLSGRISPLLHNFMMLLARKERLDRVWRIFSSYQQMLDERFGKVEVDVWTRYPLPADQGEAIRRKLQDALKREPIMHFYTDDKMIGGMRLQVGDKLIDATVDTQLRRMRERIIEDGGSELRERFGRIMEGN